MGGGGGGGGRSACCTQKCAGGAYDSAKLDRIMVRFRPIAPKPAVSGSVSGSQNNHFVLTKPRAKRRYVRVNNNKNKGGAVLEEKSSTGSEMVTLSLLPETPGSVKASSSPSSDPTVVSTTTPIQDVPIESDRTVVMQYTGSSVTVECVEGVEGNDVQMMMDLENDTCPGFISDGYNRVWWSNQAYRRMVGSDMVWLVTKDRFPLMCSAFVCRVRLQYTCKSERKSMVVPCDVWRMEGGDFAWRLDVQAALSLGR